MVSERDSSLAQQVLNQIFCKGNHWTSASYYQLSSGPRFEPVTSRLKASTLTATPPKRGRRSDIIRQLVPYGRHIINKTMVEVFH